MNFTRNTRAVFVAYLAAVATVAQAQVIKLPADALSPAYPYCDSTMADATEAVGRLRELIGIPKNSYETQLQAVSNNLGGALFKCQLAVMDALKPTDNGSRAGFFSKAQDAIVTLDNRCRSLCSEVGGSQNSVHYCKETCWLNSVARIRSAATAQELMNADDTKLRASQEQCSANQSNKSSTINVMSKQIGPIDANVGTSSGNGLMPPPPSTGDGPISAPVR